MKVQITIELTGSAETAYKDWFNNSDETNSTTIVEEFRMDSEANLVGFLNDFTEYGHDKDENGRRLYKHDLEGIKVEAVMLEE